MDAVRHRLFLFLPLAALLVACERAGPLYPEFRAASSGGFGSTPAAPSGAAAVAVSQDQIDLSWRDNSTTETGFEVFRSTEGGMLALVASTAADVTSHGDMGLTAATQYCYQIRAFKANGRRATYSSFSPVACATTDAPPPPPPSPGPPIAPSLTDAVPATSSAMWITWSDNSDNEGGFRVERSNDGGASWIAAGPAPAGTTWLYDEGRLSEQQVCYRVIAFNADGASPPSDNDCATPPAGPTNLTATRVDEATVELRWTDNSGVEDGYEVWAETSEYCLVQTMWLIETLPVDSTYLLTGWGGECQIIAYHVVATKDGGYSDWSNPAPWP